MIAVESYYTRHGSVEWKLVCLSPYAVLASGFLSQEAAWQCYDEQLS